MRATLCALVAGLALGGASGAAEAAAPVLHVDETVGLAFPLPPGWGRAQDVPGSATPKGVSWQDPTGQARLAIVVEPCPLDDLSALPAAIDEAIRTGAIPLRGTPRLGRAGGYACVTVEPEGTLPAATPHTLFVHFLVADREVAFRLVSLGQGWPEVRAAFLGALEGVVIDGLVRGAPEGPTRVLPEQGVRLAAPPGFAAVPAADLGASLARFVDPRTQAVVDLNLYRVPAIAPALLLQEFADNLAEGGLAVRSRSLDESGRWPALTLECSAEHQGKPVRVLFRCLLVYGRTLQLSCTCREEHAAALWPKFRAVADALRAGPEPERLEFWRNPASTRDDGPPRSVVLETRVDLDAGAPDPVARATVYLPLYRSFAAHQDARLVAYDAPPDAATFDRAGNATGAWYLSGLTGSRRSAVAARWAVTVRASTTEPPTTAADVELPPVLAARLLGATAGSPAGHPRIQDFARPLLAGAASPTRRAEALLRGVAAQAPGPADARADLARAGWGRGALFALASPERSGPAERSDLLVSCLRDQGLPARRLDGHLLPPRGRRGEPLPHAWVEVFLPPAGWLAADPTPLATGEAPRLGRWSDRYLYLGHGGHGLVSGQGPDAALLAEGHVPHGGPPLARAALEVTRVAWDAESAPPAAPATSSP